MIRRHSLALLTLITSITGCYAQLRLADRVELASRVEKGEKSRSDLARVDMLIKVRSGESIDLERFDATLLGGSGDIVAVSVAKSQAEALAAAPWVERAELSRQRRPLLDKAKAFAGVDRIHDGSQTINPYTGRGVIVATVDRGLDPNHLNFKDQDGFSRIGHLHYTFSEPGYSQWTAKTFARNEIARFTTDARDEFHATHSLGIMAGGYSGRLKMASAEGATVSSRWVDDSPYAGVAPGADIAVACGLTGDAQIMAGLESILEYSEAQGKRAVISLPLGSNVGLHSPKSLMNQYLASVGERALLLVAAGNDGDKPLAIKKRLAPGDNSVRSLIATHYADNVRYGKLSFEASAPVRLQAVIFDRRNGRVIYRMPLPGSLAEGDLQYYCSSQYVEDKTDISAPEFDDAFTGYVSLGWENDSDTGLYTALLSYYLIGNPSTNADNTKVLGFIAEGDEGTAIECYCDGEYTHLDNYGFGDWQKGSADGAVNEFALADNVLVVGAANAATSFATLDQAVHSADCGPLGAVASFSSWASDSPSGSLPHVCAPGAAIVSSTSTYYVEEPSNAVGINHISAQTDDYGRGYYWSAASGTSAATAFAAGTLALWLEADSTLTMSDVKSLIASTSTHSTPGRSGAGILNPLCGIRNILRLESVASPEIDSDVICTLRDSKLYVFRPGASEINITLHNLQATTMARFSSSGDELTADLAALPDGLMFVTVNGDRVFKIVKQ